ncbi:cobalamin B12-binding domain-containing protein [Yoonia sp. 208BN28-4]|uniref:cobalamin B12-binding domain-containing protein n=1 Tax=Yoonia sp. 208BN28-4 TaxID=3126505 RepID=UPI0030B29012
MTDSDSGISHDQYEKAFSDLNRLRERLPENSFISLAREVLLRVAAHATRPDLADIPATETEVENLAKALISTDPQAGSDFVAQLRAEGVSIEMVYLSYLARAARKLGTWWETDHVSLLDVTVGTGRIYAIMRAMSDLFGTRESPTQKSALFASVPDETHTLGVRMAADLLRKRGWQIDLKVGMSHDDLVAEVSESSHVIIGLSAGGEHSITDLARLFLALRLSNPNAFIMISGNVVATNEDALRLIGADALPLTFEEAAEAMESHWAAIQPTMPNT